MEKEFNSQKELNDAIKSRKVKSNETVILNERKKNKSGIVFKFPDFDYEPTNEELNIEEVKCQKKIK